MMLNRSARGPQRLWPMVPAVAAVLALGLAAGCKEEGQITSYAAPKDQPPPDRPRPAAQTPPVAEAGTRGGMLTWTLPEGWTQQTSDLPRIATIQSGHQQHPIQVFVTAFPGNVGGLTMNLNRWREQVGLQHVAEDEAIRLAVPLADAKVDGILIDMTGPEAEDYVQARQRVVVAWFLYAGQSWLFKMQDTQKAIEANLDAFLQLVHTVRPQVGSATAGAGAEPGAGGATRPAGQSPDRGADGSAATGTMAFEGETLRGVLPAGWQAATAVAAPRLASITITGEGGAVADLAVTRFPGDVGGELANVNRWRRQMGLAPVSDLTGEKIVAVRIAAENGKLYDYTAPGTAPDRNRMLVASILRHGMTWYFKLTGPADLLESQIDNLKTFLGDIEFKD